METSPVKALLKNRGGNKAVAEKLQRKPGTVNMWVVRRTIPRSAWPELMEAFPDLTLDDLKATEAA